MRNMGNYRHLKNQLTDFVKLDCLDAFLWQLPLVIRNQVVNFIVDWDLQLVDDTVDFSPERDQYEQFLNTCSLDDLYFEPVQLSLFDAVC